MIYLIQNTTGLKLSRKFQYTQKVVRKFDDPEKMYFFLQKVHQKIDTSEFGSNIQKLPGCSFSEKMCEILINL